MTFARVSLGLPDPVTQRLVMHVQLLRQPPDRRLRLRLAIQAHSTRPQLVGVLLRCGHGYFLPMISRSCLRSSAKPGGTQVLNLRAVRQAYVLQQQSALYVDAMDFAHRQRAHLEWLEVDPIARPHLRAGPGDGPPAV